MEKVYCKDCRYYYKTAQTCIRERITYNRYTTEYYYRNIGNIKNNINGECKDYEPSLFKKIKNKILNFFKKVKKDY